MENQAHRPQRGKKGYQAGDKPLRAALYQRPCNRVRDIVGLHWKSPLCLTAPSPLYMELESGGKTASLVRLSRRFLDLGTATRAQGKHHGNRAQDGEQPS